jgi:hypothetical protein
MTKAEKIWAAHRKHPKWSDAQIGAACNCRDSYVRVVLRQRPEGGGQSEIDRRWRRKREAEIGMPLSTFKRRRSMSQAVPA